MREQREKFLGGRRGLGGKGRRWGGRKERGGLEVKRGRGGMTQS